VATPTKTNKKGESQCFNYRAEKHWANEFPDLTEEMAEDMESEDDDIMLVKRNQQATGRLSSLTTHIFGQLFILPSVYQLLLP